MRVESCAAFLARKAHLLGDDDVILLSPDRVFSVALETARELAGSYQPPQPYTVPLYDGAEKLNADWTGDDVAEADRLIGERIAEIYSGEGEASADEMGEREVDTALDLLKHPKNLARVEHMAKYRRPLKDS